MMNDYEKIIMKTSALVRPTCGCCRLSGDGGGLGCCDVGLLNAPHDALRSDVILLLVCFEPDDHVPLILLGLELCLSEPSIKYKEFYSDHKLKLNIREALKIGFFP